MADLTAANVSVEAPVIVDRSMDKYLRTYPKITFGNGVLTYPALGIPMPDKGLLGFNFEILRAFIEQPANGYIYHFDRTNHKLRIFMAAAVAAHTHDLKIIGGTAAAATDTLNVKASVLGKEEAANATVAGADSATKGGVLSSGAIAAAGLAELGHVAVALTTLYLELVGR